MLNVLALPGHPLYTGVTVMVAVTGLAVALVAVNDAMFPDVPAPSPIEVSLFVQL
jgi:hypothetical protein